MCVCVCVFYNPANSTGQLNYSKREYLNIPGKELNANDITEQIFLQEKNKILLH